MAASEILQSGLTQGLRCFSVSSCLACGSQFSHSQFGGTRRCFGAFRAVLSCGSVYQLAHANFGTLCVISPGWFIDNTRQRVVVALPDKSKDNHFTEYKSGMKSWNLQNLDVEVCFVTSLISPFAMTGTPFLTSH